MVDKVTDDVIVAVTEPPLPVDSSENININTIVRCASSDQEEADDDDVDPDAPMTQEVVVKAGVSKEIYTVTKLMITVSVAAILVNANNNPQHEFKSWVACVETSAQVLALLLMFVGIYVRVEWPSVSKWSQIVGHFICFTCLLFLHTPLLRLPSSFFWLTPLLLLSLFLLAFFHCPHLMIGMMMMIVLRPSSPATPIATQPNSGESGASEGAVVGQV